MLIAFGNARTLLGSIFVRASLNVRDSGDKMVLCERGVDLDRGGGDGISCDEGVGETHVAEAVGDVVGVDDRDGVLLRAHISSLTLRMASSLTPSERNRNRRFVWPSISS